MILYLLILVLYSSNLIAYSQETETIQTKSGPITGVVQKTAAGAIVDSYLGVPFGQAPVGDLRFLPPQPVQAWSAPRKADTLANACFYTLDTYFPGFEGAEMWNAKNEQTEDCLAMNIWVPRGVHDGTVLVWIFGGGFFSGSPSLDLYDGKEMAVQGRVIVVNIGYRLGPFGFLYLGEDSSAPGNMGLLDQQLALKWIQENIASFGGDPSKVTLFGESAGAASVSAHMVAPGSRDLFRYGILQSGSMSEPWASASTETMLTRSLSLAEKLDCKSTDMEQVATCIRGKTKQEIQTAADEVAYEVRMMEFAFVPVVKDANFFTQDVHEAISSGNIKNGPMFFGTNSDEGTYWLPYYVGGGFTFDPSLDINGPENQALIDSDEYMAAIEMTTAGYFCNEGVNEAIAQQYSSDNSACSGGQYNSAAGCEKNSDSAFRDATAKIFNDLFFTCDNLKYGDAVTKAGNKVYSYFFSQRSSANPWALWMGVMHGYEIEYIFGVPLSANAQDKYTDDEKRFSRTMIHFVTYFARFGEPSVDWPVFGEDANYVQVEIWPLGGEGLFQHKNLFGERCAFWENQQRCNV